MLAPPSCWRGEVSERGRGEANYGRHCEIVISFSSWKVVLFPDPTQKWSGDIQPIPQALLSFSEEFPTTNHSLCRKLNLQLQQHLKSWPWSTSSTFLVPKYQFATVCTVKYKFVMKPDESAECLHWSLKAHLTVGWARGGHSHRRNT